MTSFFSQLSMIYSSVVSLNVGKIYQLKFEKLSEYVKELEEFFELLKSGKAHYEHKCNLCKGSLITNSYVLNCGCLAFCNKCSYKLIRERKKCLICKNFVLTRHLVFIDSMRVKWIRKNHTQDDIIQVE